MNISEEAVEAASGPVDDFTEALFGAVATYKDRDELARKILEAAAPHLMAQAWLEGRKSHADKFANNPYFTPSMLDAKPTVEWVRKRPGHPVYIPEHMRGTVREIGSAGAGE
jgi:hypothetical protein